MYGKAFRIVGAALWLAVAAGLPARAAQWVPTVKSAAGAFALDEGSLDIRKNVGQVWVREDLAQPAVDQKTGKNYSVEVERQAYDCARHRYASGAYARHDPSGAVVAQGERNQDWKDVVPGSIGEFHMKAVCALADPPSEKPLIDMPAAGVWRSLGAVADGSYTIYAKMDDIVQIKPGFVLVGTRSNYTAPRQQHGDVFSALIEAYVIDCANLQVAVAGVDGYLSPTWRTFSVRTDPDHLQFMPAAPGTFIARDADQFCSASALAKSGKPRDDHEDTGLFSGTAWGVDKGYLVTASHVIKDGKKIAVYRNGEQIGQAKVVVDDPANDLAILKFIRRPKGPLKILPLAERAAPLGRSIFTLGYPAPDILGQRIKMAAGQVSGTAGMQDDARYLQISIPIQEGNSGGPVLGWDGSVVGVVESKLTRFGEESNSPPPENVNYAIKASYLRPMLEDLPDLGGYEPVKPSADQEEMVRDAQAAVFMLLVSQ